MDTLIEKRASRKSAGKAAKNINIVIQKLILPPGSTPETFLKILMQLPEGSHIKFQCLEIAE